MWFIKVFFSSLHLNDKFITFAAERVSGSVQKLSSYKKQNVLRVWIPEPRPLGDCVLGESNSRNVTITDHSQLRTKWLDSFRGYLVG